jgi:hypothetical protein
MVTAKEINLASQDGVRSPDEEGESSIVELIRDECDIFIEGIGVLTWEDAFRDPDDPATWVVLYKHDDVLYAIYGYYDSWSGVDYDDLDFYPVEAKQVTTTRYVKRKEA